MTAWTYRVFDDTQRLIYVGSTTHLWNRLVAHKKSWWAHQTTRVKANVHPTIEAARDCERRAIANENPRWNVMGRWASRGSWHLGDYRDYLNAIVLKGNAHTAANQEHIRRVTQECLFRFGVDPSVPRALRLVSRRSA